MRVVIVMDENWAAMRVVSTRMTPVERASKNHSGERNCEASIQKTRTRAPQPHRSRL